MPAVQYIPYNHCTLRSFYAVDADILPIVSLLYTTKLEVNNVIKFLSLNPINMLFVENKFVVMCMTNV